MCISVYFWNLALHWFAVTNETSCLVHLQLQMTDAMDNLEELLRLSGGDGQIFTMEGPLCMKSVQAMFGYDLFLGKLTYILFFSFLKHLLYHFTSLFISRRLIDYAYSPFHAVLHCGNLSSDVQVFPRPEPIVVDEEVEPMPRTVNTGTQPASHLFI